MKAMVFIAAGGAIGAVARYLVTSGIGKIMGSAFPWGTLTVNVVGCFVLGVLVESMALAWNVSTPVRAFLIVGIMGAFTTFSSFSLDVAVLYERGEVANAAAYVIASVVLSVCAMFAGLAIVRVVMA